MVIKPLTSIRFFFALMVFMTHVGILFQADANLKHLYENVFSEGFMGVSFFFILSGFILSLNYKEDSQLKSYKRIFILKRILRIYPLHIITLIFMLPFSFPGIWTLKSLSFWIIKLMVQVLLLQSFIPLESVFYSFNGPSWSLSDEMFFYILFPFLLNIYSLNQKWIKFLLPLMVFFIIGLSFIPEKWHLAIVYVQPPVRIMDFILGILLYQFYKVENIKIKRWILSRKLATIMEIGVIILFVLFFAFHYWVPLVYRYSIYYWIPGSLLIFVFSLNQGAISKILSQKIFEKLGEISFSFYLVHGVVLEYFLFQPRNHFIKNDMGMVLGLFFITLFISFPLYKYIELPIKNWAFHKLKSDG